MAVRMCPQCGKTVPATRVIALSNGMDCPHCQSRLEVATGSRMIATAVGMGFAWVVWRVTRDSTNILGFALPVLLSFLAFGIVSPLVLMFTASLRSAPAEAVFAPVAAHGGHAASVHAGGHH